MICRGEKFFALTFFRKTKKYIAINFFLCKKFTYFAPQFKKTLQKQYTNMSKVCQITGKKAMTGNNVSHSNTKTKRVFDVNLFDKKYYLAEEDRWISLRVSANGIRTINKKGLFNALKDAKAKGFIQTF